MDLTKLSDDELRSLYAQPDPRADMPAATAEPVASRVMPDLKSMSDEQLLALHAMPEPPKPSMLESAVTGIAQGATFGYADEIGGVLKGGIPGLFNGKGFQAGYEAERDRFRHRDKAAEEAHPWVNTGAKVAGNVAGALPLMAYFPTAMGVTGGGLAARTGWSALSGLGLGAMQGFGEGEGSADQQVDDSMWGAAGGGALGGLAPVAGQVAGRVARPVLQAMADRGVPVPGFSNQAATMLTEDFRNAGGRGAIESRMAELGPEARLYHAAPSFEGSAQGLAIRPETRDVITNDVRGLRAGSNDRLAGDLDAATFPAPNTTEVLDQFQGQRDRLQPLYGREEARARPLSADEGGNLWDLADGLAATQKGPGQAMLEQAAEMIAPLQRGPGGRTVRTPDLTPEGLMQSRHALDGMIARVEADDGLRTAGVGARLQQLRQAVDDQVRAINPEIKNLDRAYETSAQSTGAYRQGQNFMGRDVEPYDVAARFNAAPMEQQAAERLGARNRIAREVGNTNRDLVALRNVVKTDGTWNRDKLATYFGDEGAERIFNAVDREAAFEESARRLVDNSQTAQRTEAAARFRPRGETAADTTMPLAAISGGVTGGPAGSAGAMTLAGVVKAFRSAGLEAGKSAAIDRNKEIARFLRMRSGDPNTRTTLDALERRAGWAGAVEVGADRTRMLVEALLRSQGNEAGRAGRSLLAR